MCCRKNRIQLLKYLVVKDAYIERIYKEYNENEKFKSHKKESIFLYSGNQVIRGRKEHSVINDGIIHGLREYLDYTYINFHTCQLRLKKDFDMSIIENNSFKKWDYSL